MGGDKNPTYPLIFSKMFLFLFRIFLVYPHAHTFGNKRVFKRLKVSRHSLALYDALLRLVDYRAPFLRSTMVLALGLCEDSIKVHQENPAENQVSSDQPSQADENDDLVSLESEVIDLENCDIVV